MKRHLAAMILAVAALTVPVAAAGPAFAWNPDEVLDDPALEERAREITRELRCVVCQNQSIDDSNAPLARDLRVLVREKLSEGATDDQVFDYVTARYGDFVLLKPPFKASTAVLWLAPAGVFLAGALGVAAFLRRRTADAAAPLSADEKRRLDALLAGEDGR